MNSNATLNTQDVMVYILPSLITLIKVRESLQPLPLVLDESLAA